jgi:D-amino peptidase
MKKKYMIRCDIEGVSGVVSYKQSEPGNAEYFFGKKMLMADLIAMTKGLKEGGANEIVIYDEHYYGRNIDLDLLAENVSVICGKPPYKKNWAGGLDKTFTGLILLGFHSKYNNYNGLLHHSYELDIKNIILNGVSVGEIGVEAAIAGDYEVPLLMVTGDSEGVAEAKKLVKGVQGVIVKESLCAWGGICYPTTVTSEIIRKKAKEITEGKPLVKPYYQGNKVIMKIEFNEGLYLNAFYLIYKDKMENNNEIILKGSSTTEVWSEYWEMKLNAQKEIGED